jgi:hypothetical protein
MVEKGARTQGGHALGMDENGLLSVAEDLVHCVLDLCVWLVNEVEGTCLPDFFQEEGVM